MMTDQLKQAITAAQTAKGDTSDSASNDMSNDIKTDINTVKAAEQSVGSQGATYKTTHTAVRKARRFAMQGLYEWLITDRRFDLIDQQAWKANAPHDIAARTRATNAMHTVHIGYYHDMMREIPQQIDALDALIADHLDRDIAKLDTVEHAILLIGAYELKDRLEIPYKVVLDEAMKLNTHFGATDAHKLINAVLDKMAAHLRAIEVQADSQTGRAKSASSVTSSPAASVASPSGDHNSGAHQSGADPHAQTSANASDQPASLVSDTEPRKPRIRINKAAGPRKRRTPATASSQASTASSDSAVSKTTSMPPISADDHD